LAKLEADLKRLRGDSDGLFQSLQAGAKNLYQRRRDLQGIVEHVSQLEKRARDLELR
jgi:ABC-type transporter Mla subunit MlaD